MGLRHRVCVYVTFRNYIQTGSAPYIHIHGGEYTYTPPCCVYATFRHYIQTGPAPMWRSPEELPSYLCVCLTCCICISAGLSLMWTSPEEIPLYIWKATYMSEKRRIFLKRAMSKRHMLCMQLICVCRTRLHADITRRNTSIHIKRDVYFWKEPYKRDPCCV